MLKGSKQRFIFQERHDKPSQREVRLAIDELRQAFPSVNAVTTNPDVLRTYGFSENSYHPASPHSVVVMSTYSQHVRLSHFIKVRPKRTEDVVKIVNISRKFMLPIIAYSGATSLEGHTSGVSTLSLFFVSICSQHPG